MTEHQRAIERQKAKVLAEINLVRRFIRASNGRGDYPCSIAEVMRVLDQIETRINLQDWLREGAHEEKQIAMFRELVAEGQAMGGYDLPEPKK